MIKKIFPKYNITLPSGKKVSFRPFVVKEENALLIAKQSENNKNILQTLIDVMNVCFEDDTSNYTLADFEYAFLNLRGKSIGEIEKATIRCPETNEEVITVVDCINDIKIKENKQENVLKLLNKKVKLKSILIKEILNNPYYTNSFENKVEFIAKNIVHIEQDREIIEFNTLTEQEKIEFINNLTSKEFKAIVDYFDNENKVYFMLNYITTDDAKHTIELSGLFNIISFFLII
jgi:hypothetical protein